MRNTDYVYGCLVMKPQTLNPKPNVRSPRPWPGSSGSCEDMETFLETAPADYLKDRLGLLGLGFKALGV